MSVDKLWLEMVGSAESLPRKARQSSPLSVQSILKSHFDALDSINSLSPPEKVKPCPFFSNNQLISFGYGFST